MALEFNTKYPSIDDLRNKEMETIPKFAFEYLDGGCNDDVNLIRNTSELREVQLKPNYLRSHRGSSMNTNLFGIEYSAPIGIAPIGLQGLIWPNAAEIFAKLAFDHNIPFILSTVTTTSIERASEFTEGMHGFSCTILPRIGCPMILSTGQRQHTVPYWLFYEMCPRLAIAQGTLETEWQCLRK